MIAERAPRGATALPTRGRPWLTRVAGFRPPDAVIGAVLALLIAASIVRGIVLVHGWIEYTADFAINIHGATEMSQWSTAWNNLMGDDNSAMLSMTPALFVPLSFMDSAAVQKLLLSAAYFAMAFGSFWAMRSWLREQVPARVALLAAAATSLLYTVNPWVSAESIHLFYLFLYALIPVTFHFVRTALNAPGWRQALARSATAGMVTTATLTAFGLLFHTMLAALLILVFVVARRRPVRATLARAATAVFGFAAGLLATSAYWLLPILLGFHTNFSNGTSWALFTTKDMYTLSPVTALPYAARGMYRDVSQFLAGMVLPDWIVAVGMACGFVLVIAVAVSIAARGHFDRTSGALLAAGAVFLLLANGTGFPTGDTYALLSGAPVLSSLGYVLLKGPYKLVPMALFCLIFLAVRCITLLATGDRIRRAVAGVLSVAAATWCVVMGSPLLTGNLDGYMRPVQPPQAFVAAMDQQAAMAVPGDGNREVWLPMDSTGSGAPPDWAPQRVTIPLLDGRVAPVPSWTASAPMSSRSVTWLGPAAGRYFDQFLQHVITDEPNANVAALMGAAGRRDIVVRTDGGYDSAALLSALSRRPDMESIAQNQWFQTFRARTAPSGGGALAPGIVVGGFDQIAVESARDVGGAPARQYVLAADLSTLAPTTRDTVLRATNEVSFAPGKSWSDLVLDTWDQPDQIQPAASMLAVTTPLNNWDKDVTESNTWVPSRLAGMNGQLFEPGLGGALAVATQAASLTVPHRGVSGGREVWIRALTTPAGVSVSAQLDGLLVGGTSTHAFAVAGWHWMNLGVADISDASLLTVSVVGSLSAVDRIALLPPGSVLSRAGELSAALSSAEITSGGAWSNLNRSVGIEIPVSAKTPSAVAVSGDVVADTAQRPDALLTLSGHSHPSSGYFAVGIHMGRVNWSGSRLVTVRVDDDVQVPPSAMSVRLHDAYGESQRYAVLPDDQAGTVTIDLGSPGYGQTNAGGLDLAAITQLDLGLQRRIPANRPVNLTVRSVASTTIRPDERRMYVPRDGAYQLIVRTTDPRALPGMTVGGARVTQAWSHNGWSASTPMGLRAGDVLVTGQLPDAAYVTLWSAGVGAAPFLLQPPAADNAAKSVATDVYEGALSGVGSGVAILNQPYNDGWTATVGGQPMQHVRLNGVVNGFIATQAAGPVRIEFAPDRWLLPGRLLTVAAILLISGSFVWIAVIQPRRRRS
ncbi:MAG TPA: hypothetical protein VGQ42_01545 [Candidatus Dormibacteraeota bacterium]|nr:hypothetical protein [Candidatus Dormibacteraeota bacterium]